MKRRASLSVALGIVLSLVLSSQADEWQWRRIAWEDNAVYSVGIPSDSGQVMYASIGGPDMPFEDMGVYKSEDGGSTWRFLPESNSQWLCALTIDPKNSSIVYCGSCCILFDSSMPELYPKRTRDAGGHWETILEPLYRIVPSPWIDGLLLATIRGLDWGWGLSRSTDDGETWTEFSGTDGGAGISDYVIFHHEDSLTVFSWIDLGPEWGLARSFDGGFEWEIVLNGRISGFDQDPSDGDHWVAIEYPGQSEPALFAESFDNGDSWETWPLPDPILYVGQLSFDLLDPEILYVVESISTGMGIYRSMDGGHVWEPMNTGLPETEFTFQVFQRKGKPGRLLAARIDGLWEWTDQQGGDFPGGFDPDVLRIEWVRPCPFLGSVEVAVAFPEQRSMSAAVYSLDGALVSRLVKGSECSAARIFTWDGRLTDGREASPGAYMLKIDADDQQVTCRLIKVR